MAIVDQQKVTSYESLKVSVPAHMPYFRSPSHISTLKLVFQEINIFSRLVAITIQLKSVKISL